NCDRLGTSVNVGHHSAWVKEVLSGIAAPDVDKDVDGPEFQPGLCVPDDRPPNGRTCLIYVSSPSTLAEAEQTYETLRRRRVPALGIWETPNRRFAVTVCEGPDGPLQCPAGKPVADRIRSTLKKDAGYDFRIQTWRRLKTPLSVSPPSASFG